MLQKILLINGPNLNLLGKRRVKLYGTIDLAQIVSNLQKRIPSPVTLASFQNNIEGEIVNFLNSEFIEHVENKIKIIGIIINPGAYTHTSIAIRDALEIFHEEHINIFEVHLSNIFQREEFRHKSYISSLADGVIAGLGVYGYQVALLKILELCGLAIHD